MSQKQQPGFSSASSGAAGSDRLERVVARPAWALLAVLGLALALAGAWLQAPDPMPGKLQPKTFWEWLRYPVESNAMLRLPGAPGTMLGVHMNRDGKTLWVVGRGGAILHSKDAGQTWESRASGTPSDLIDITFDAQGENGWAVGTRGGVTVTHDGGKTWAVSRQTLDGGLLLAVHAVNAQTVWVASSAGLGLVSEDGGRTWGVRYLMAAKDRLAAIRFDKSGRVGWAVGKGVILKTTNGGANWQEVQVPEACKANKVQFDVIRFLDDGRRGWVSTRSGALLRTVDAGQSWVLQPLRADQPACGNPAGKVKAADIRGLAVSEGGRLWLTTTRGAIETSDDAGASWQPAVTVTSTLVRSIAMDAAGVRGWAVGVDGVILSTDDRGETWADRTSGADAVALAAHVGKDSRKLWVAGHGGLVLASANGGRDWVRQAVADEATDGDIYDLTFLDDDRRGWAVTGEGRVLSTTDGGAQWSSTERLTPSRLKTIHADAGGQKLWAGGEDGALWASTDGGQSWVPQPHPAPKTINWTRVQFLDDGVSGWVTGSGGWLLSTRNGGADWQGGPVSVRMVAQDPGAGGGAPFDLDVTGPPITDALRDIRFVPGTRTGWLVGDAGTVLKTVDGVDWQELPPTSEIGLRTSLLAVRFSADGRTGWAAGEGGAIRVTLDGGQHWTAATAPVASADGRQAALGSARTALAMDRTGRTGLAVGYPPALLQTDNFGEDWKPLPWPLRYARYPAPWFWLALLLVAGAVWRALKPETVAPVKGAEAMGTTDAPTEVFERDRLQFGPLARGISRFLRNKRTEPPLTMAVSGDWGTGKSSLMALVCADLRRYGSRPVWFNAWHHQSEEQLLGALLAAIREKGLPPVGTPDGGLFRLRLLWLRSRKNFILTILALLALSALISFLMQHSLQDWSRLGQRVADLARPLEAAAKGEARPLSNQDVGSLGGQLVALLGVVLYARKVLKAFGADPGALAAATASNLKIKDLAAQTSFRARFAEQFDEVTQALPYRLVIVIDDLDRCKSDAVQSVMEAVNFLVSSGRCFVLFGMSAPRVEAALSLAFTPIAKELALMQASGEPGGPAPLSEVEHRQAYVRDYLRKLINLDIKVPERTNPQPERLLEAQPLPDQGSMAALGRQALTLWPLWLGAAVIVCGAVLGGHLSLNPLVSRNAAADSHAGTAADGVSSPVEAGSASAALRDPKLPLPTGPGGRLGQEAEDTVSHTMQPADVSPTPPWLLGLVLGVFVLAAGGVLVYRARTSARRVDDTPQFAEALRTWLPVVACGGTTPRQIKRFGNRLRYLAMLQQGEALDDSLLDELRRRLGRLGQLGQVGQPAAPEPAAPAEHSFVLEEHRLVALGALEAIYGKTWRTQLAAGPGSAGAGSAELRAAVEQAIAAYVEQTGSVWPPSSEEQDLFERALAGVRAAGVVERLSATAAAPGAPAAAPVAATLTMPAAGLSPGG
jgi:photosystem II stability/assembly factor-like uncharacterized protein